MELHRRQAEPASIVDLLQHMAGTHSGQVAYTFLQDGELEAESLTYEELDQKARAVGAWLQSAGAAGQRVLLLHRPGLAYLAGFFGCLYAGATAVPAYPPRTPQMLQQLQAIAADAATRLALTDDFVMAHVAGTPAVEALHWVSTESLPPALAGSWQHPALTGDAPAFLQYTSGSTGAPKGVMVTHRNLLHNAEALRTVMDLRPEDREVSWLPLYHDMGLITEVIAPLLVGMHSIIMSPEAFMQRPMRWLEAMSRYKATATGAPNFGYDLVLLKSTAEERAALDLSAWRVAFNGAEAVRSETLSRFSAAFAPAGFRLEAFSAGYGLAEATLVVSATPHDRPPVIRKGVVGCGPAVPDMQVIIVHPEQRVALPAGEVGEVWVAGPSVAAGYWNRPDATAETFGAHLADTGAGPFLRTGDLGFLDEQGELFITGRIKELIIVRGRNHYPQDIEKAAEAGCAALMPGAGAAFTADVDGEERLVLTYELRPDFQGDAMALIGPIREAVSRAHELQVYSVSLVRPGTLPRTMSGKVQRFACRKAWATGGLSVVAASTARAAAVPEDIANLPVAEGVRRLIAAVLKVPAVDPSVSVAALGLDSLAAVELTHQVQAKFGVTLPIAELLEGPTVAQLAVRVAELQTLCVARPAVAAAGAGDFPASHGQQSLWFLWRMAPDSAAYNIARAVRYHNLTDEAAYLRALQRLVDRHPALRTTFHAGETGAIQRVHATAEVYCKVEDAPADLQARLEAESQRPFDLENGPLMRMHLFRLPEGGHVCLLSLHHIIADLWSLTIFMQELGALYAAEAGGTPADLPEPGAQYTAHVQWQREMLAGPEGEALLAYWKEQFSGELPVLNLPTDRPRPAVQTYAGGSRSLTLDAGLSARITKLGRKHGATPFATLLAAYQAFLHRYTGQDDIIVGSPTAGRTRSELAGVMGYFVNPVALRTRVDGSLPFTGFLTQVKEKVVGALARSGYPFPLLVEKLQVERDPSRTPVYQTMFVLQRAHKRQEFNAIALAEAGSRFHMGPLESESLPVWQMAATCDLTLFAAEVEGEYRLSLEYNTDLFDEATIDRMLSHFRNLLTAIAEAPDTPVDDLPLLTEAEREQLVYGWNQTEADYPWTMTLPELFELQAERTPDAPAVAGALTFAELNGKANQLARFLRQQGVGPDVLVGVCMERTPDLVVALLAVLKAGGAYLPLDPSYPQERLAYMLADSQAPVLLTQPALLTTLPSTTAHVFCVDSGLIQPDDANLEPLAGPENLAYIIYTSGSTGRPKGALIEHRGLVNYLWWAIGAYKVKAGGGAPVHSSVSFDLTVTSLWAPLLAGRPVAMVPESLGIEGLAAALREPGGFSLVKLTPAHVELISRQLTPAEAARAAGALVIGGEALLPETVAFFREHAPNTALINEYGPTETVVGCCVYWVKPGEVYNGSIPIGRPIANTYLYILDKQRRPVPVGVAGELYIGGDGVCRGYLNRPELTAERFLADPFRPGSRMYKTGDLARWLPDGHIDFLGRMDEQVKLRGFRIELGEIETAIAAHPSVQTAVAVVRQDGPVKQLVAYVVPRQEGFDPGAVRQTLLARLPEYMIPTAWVAMSELPLSPNGKVDRKALPAPAAAAADFTAPATPAEAILAGVFAQVLGRAQVSTTANFFELGGDSIQALQVVSRAGQAGLKLSPRDLFQHPTVAALAAVAVAAPVINHEAPVTGPVTLAPIQRWFLGADPADPHHYNQAVLLELKRPLTAAALEQALTRLTEHHDALRLRFTRGADGAWSQTCAAPGARAAVATYAQYSEAAAAEVQASLDLEHGPLLKAALFPAHLLIVIHHLAVDGVSWRILLEDLELLLRDPEAALPPKTVSYQQWAASQDSLPEKLQLDPRNTQASEAKVTVALTAEETRTLLQEAGAAYRTRIDDLLLTALVRAAAAWTGRPGPLVVDLESHGREGDLDLSRTVGWFTAITPVRLQEDPAATLEFTLKAVKEQLRSRTPDHTAAPEISFNYLGQMDQSLAGSAFFAPSHLPAGPSRSPRQLRRHALEVDAMVIGDRLELTWNFSLNLHERHSIAELAHGYLSALRALIAHCTAPDAGGCTPSDFPLAGLDQPILDRVLRKAAEVRGATLRQLLSDLQEITGLTSIQQEMLDYTALAPASGVWMCQVSVALAGPLDRPALERAWREVSERYCPLRSTFLPVPRGRAVRLVSRQSRTPLTYGDWTGITPDVAEARLEQLRHRPFHFAAEVPVRADLIRTGADAHRLALTFHHAVLDGWSVSLLLKELFTRYAGHRSGGPGVPYAAYLAWLADQDQSAAQAYWRSRLTGYTLPQPLGSEGWWERRAEPMTGARRSTSVRFRSERLPGLTLNTAVQGAWALLLSALTERDDVVYGSVMAGRPADLPGAGEMIGLLMNTVPIRARIQPEAKVVDWLAGLQAQLSEAGEHQYTPAAQAARWAGVAQGAPLFESAVFFENYPVDAALKEGVAGLRVSDLRFSEQHHYPLSLIAVPGEELLLQINYHRARFAPADIDVMARSLAALLEAMAADPSQTLGELLTHLPSAVHFSAAAGND